MGDRARGQEPELPSGLPKVGKPAGRALQSAGYHTLEQLNGASEAALLKLHGVGPKAIRILREAMEARGFQMAD